MIPIYEPYISKRTKDLANEAISSTWISSTGKYKDLASNKLKDILGVKNVLLTSNGTTATHLVAKALKYKNPNIKKIIAPNNVYVAAWNSFLFDKEYEIIPVDADLNTWNIDLDLLDTEIKKHNDTAAVLIVPNLGNIINVPELKRKYPNIVFVEDNCEGLFGKYDSHYAGTQSLASSLSFYGNKTITCGEGGAVLTNDDEIYSHLNKIHGQGQKKGQRYVHDALGYNYRMTNVAAAILYGQLLDLPEILERKNNLFETYRKEFNLVEGINLQKIENKTCHSNWMMGIRTKFKFEKVKKFMEDNNIEIRPMFYPMSVHDHLREISDPLNEENSKLLSEQCFMIPSFPTLRSEEIKHVISTIKKMVRSL